MNLPQIDVSHLPDLATLTGVFGSSAHPGNALVAGDTAVILMVFVHDCTKF